MGVFDSDEWAAWVDEVRERPDDDTLRLMIADWLEERAGKIWCATCRPGEIVIGVDPRDGDQVGKDLVSGCCLHGAENAVVGRLVRWQTERVNQYNADRYAGPGVVTKVGVNRHGLRVEIKPSTLISERMNCKDCGGTTWVSNGAAELAKSIRLGVADGSRSGFVTSVVYDWEHWLKDGDDLIRREPIRVVRLMNWPLPAQTAYDVVEKRWPKVKEWHIETDTISPGIPVPYSTALQRLFDNGLRLPRSGDE